MVDQYFFSLAKEQIKIDLKDENRKVNELKQVPWQKYGLYLTHLTLCELNSVDKIRYMLITKAFNLNFEKVRMAYYLRICPLET